MRILREILKTTIFVPLIAWFILVALRGGLHRNYAFVIAFNSMMCIGFFLVTAAIYVYALKPSFLQSPSKDGQGQGS